MGDADRGSEWTLCPIRLSQDVNLTNDNSRNPSGTGDKSSVDGGKSSLSVVTSCWDYQQPWESPDHLPLNRIIVGINHQVSMLCLRIFSKHDCYKVDKTHRGLPGDPPVHTQPPRVLTLKIRNLETERNIRVQRLNIQRGWNVFMVKIFLNSNFAHGYCLDLNNCTKRWNCRTVKNEQLNESFSNYTHFAYTEQQCHHNSRDSSAVSTFKVVTKSHPTSGEWKKSNVILIIH